MKKLIACLVAILFVGAVKAQTLKIPTKADLTKTEQNVKSEANKVADQSNAGNLISQLTNNISDSAFTDSFKKNKSDYLGSLKNVKDAKTAGKSLQTLQEGILPAAMSTGWNSIKDKWIKDASTANTLKSVAGIAGKLESNISDKYFKSSWLKARPAWQAGLKVLAQ